MKRIVTLVISLTFLFCVVDVYAQSDLVDIGKTHNVKSIDHDKNSGSGSSSAAGTGLSHNYVDLGEECGMFLNEEYQPATITMKDGNVIDEKFVRYNIYNQQMEYVTDEGASAIGNPGEISKMKIGDQVFFYQEFVFKDRVYHGYLELLEQGNCELFLYRGIKYTSHESPGPIDNSKSIKKYYMDKTFYYTCNNSTLTLLPEKKKEIIASLPVPKDDVQAYLKKTGNKLKKDSELVDLFVYVNQH